MGTEVKEITYFLFLSLPYFLKEHLYWDCGSLVGMLCLSPSLLKSIGTIFPFSLFVLEISQIEVLILLVILLYFPGHRWRIKNEESSAPVKNLCDFQAWPKAITKALPGGPTGTNCLPITVWKDCQKRTQLPLAGCALSGIHILAPGLSGLDLFL